MRLIRWVTISVTLAVLYYASALPASAAGEEGVAVAIVYDTSGSMNESVKDATGKPCPKYLIANRALVAIANRIQAFATNGTAGSSRKIHAGLFVFQNDGPYAALPLGPFNAAAFTTWARGFSAPNGGTPLGSTLNTAGHAVLNSNLTRKHVLVITDGENNIGPDPSVFLGKLQQEAGERQTSVSVHFVAFDVDAKVFHAVKKIGATVVGASNESQLNTQLELILEKKILLEDEEPPKQK